MVIYLCSSHKEKRNYKKRKNECALILKIRILSLQRNDTLVISTLLFSTSHTLVSAKLTPWSSDLEYDPKCYYKLVLDPKLQTKILHFPDCFGFKVNKTVGNKKIQVYNWDNLKIISRPTSNILYESIIPTNRKLFKSLFLVEHIRKWSHCHESIHHLKERKQWQRRLGIILSPVFIIRLTRTI